jgi:hypothetical protein
MIRLTFALPLLAIIVAFVGCSGELPAKQYGEYDKSEVEAFVAKYAEQASGIQLREFNLKPKDESGVFVGTCVNGDGVQFQVEVTQEPNRIAWKAISENLTVSGSRSQ